METLRPVPEINENSKRIDQLAFSTRSTVDRNLNLFHQSFFPSTPCFEKSASPKSYLTKFSQQIFEQSSFSKDFFERQKALAERAELRRQALRESLQPVFRPIVDPNMSVHLSPGTRNPNDLPIGDYLNCFAKDRRPDKQEPPQAEPWKPNEKSNSLMAFKLNKFARELFDSLNRLSVRPEILDIEMMEIEQIEPEILRLIYPFILALRDIKHSIDFDSFYEIFEEFYQSLSQLEKNELVLPPPQKKPTIIPSFKPTTNHRSLFASHKLHMPCM